MNKKSDLPFNCDRFLIYDKGSRSQSRFKPIYNVIPKIMEPSNGFEPNFTQNLCIISVMKIP